jgi:radical SAM protein with 4Fe4S-binding SPASM domain
MDDSVIEKSIQLIKTWQKSSGCTICWYGGEPLLKFDLIKKWTPVIKKELPKAKTSITTNGSLITQEVMDFMDEHGIGMLFSLDGPQWVHDRTRVFAGGKPSWDKIDPLKIIKWRPDTEIAWQITPEGVPEPSDLDWMILNGFSKINFNINWLSEWGPEAQEKLRDFMYHAISRVILYRSKLNSQPFNTNWYTRLEKYVRGAGTREEKPCGTGMGMLSVTPEGDLYPSQEMGFMVHEPGKAPGTAEFYKLGNVLRDPVWEPDEKLQRIYTLKNDDMVPPPGRDCTLCPVRSISFGGCHCRYVGQDGVDPSYRYNVMPGWCQSQIAAASGGLMAFARYGKVVLADEVQKSSDNVRTPSKSGVARHQLTIVDLDRKLDRVLEYLEGLND